LTTGDLDALFNEEITVWRERYDWDFRPSADLLRRFLQIRSLYGRALIVRGRVAGYAYFVCEAKKGLIGDFYLASQLDTRDREAQLLEDVLTDMRAVGIRRVESQLMMLRHVEGPFPSASNLFRQDRNFMEAPAAAISRLESREPSFQVHIKPYDERHDEEMAHLLAASYRGHIDSEINDQYRSIPGARQFLMNIIRFPGCGRFAPEASVVALDAGTGRLCGMCLSSRVSDTAGHITQLCILPALRRSGLGYELMRRTAFRLVESGSQRVGLTVTCANVDAVRLYTSAGFRIVSRFPALVWQGI
jgi:GNAT superfamily N-acetyltransferase